ncbi:Toll-interacting protein [Trichostrongylus colubriformis]|uniref:Toll-interacting protein n=1 Tax=Trichostrongylus colubriformis TaxID=6319 RepID=A0AAN8IRR2_TRICO
MSSTTSVAERRRQVLVGELPVDFLRLIVPRDQVAPTSQQQQTQQLVYTGGSFVPPNTRGRLSITIADANLVRNYGIVRMDPYCRLRVGHAVFETQTKLSGGRSPVWNRTVHAYLPNGVESIYIQIFDEKAFSADECVAWAHVMLPQAIFSGETIDDYYPLSGQQGEGKEGMLHLVISFAPVEAAIPTAVVLPAAVSPPVPESVDGIPISVEITAEDTKELEAMFPSVDKEVIRCVLEESRGDKDATVSALLEMNKT